ncbi:MAG: twin-arginine translocation signal domain-containing protein, partial [Mucilaginibacter polytrichastri]|nr:twin-arginine translocation signal domain-containing protein [Mucilaginibacter polytrichastri]
MNLKTDHNTSSIVESATPKFQRRNFLKYAGASAAALGLFAAGCKDD